MKIVLRVIAAWLALGILIQGQTLMSDLGDWSGLTRWAGPFAAWFVFSEFVHVIGGIVGSIQLWRLKNIGRIIGIVVSVMDGLHNLVPWLLGPPLAAKEFRLGGSDVFGIVMSVVALAVLLHPMARKLCTASAPSLSVS